MRNRLLLFFVMCGLGLAMALALWWAVGSPVEASTGAAHNIQAQEYTVCPIGCDFTTIQDAVDFALDGDTIKVAGGLYNEVNGAGSLSQVVYISKTITIRGGYSYPFPDWITPGVLPTVIDAQSEGRGIYITGHVSPTLEYLHITGGEASGLGGGPWSYDGAGGGIYVVTATATISHCNIYDNLAGRFDWSGGGGIYLYSSPSILKYNTIISNTAGVTTTGSFAGEGGGVAMSGSDAVLVSNLIANNTAAEEGMGLGGGIYMESGYPILDSNVIRDNSASLGGAGQGGGIFNGFYCPAWLVNTVLTGNYSGPVAGSFGTAIAVEYSSPVLIHSTIHDNTGYDGVGVYLYGPGEHTISMTNTILANQIMGIEVTAGNTGTIDSILLHGNESDTGGAGLISMTNYITGTPSFSPDGIHLMVDSAAIDAGVDAGVAWDIDNEGRPYGSGYDLGADEATGTVTEIIDPILGGTLVFTDPSGLATTVEVPPGAISETVVFVYTPLLSPTHPLTPGVQFAGHAFELNTFCFEPVKHHVFLPLVLTDYVPGATPMESTHSQTAPDAVSKWQRPASSISADEPVPCTLALNEPLTITIHYSDDDVSGIDEGTLSLTYWEVSHWQDTALTCSPPSSYIRDLEGNALGIAICHLTEFAMIGD